MSQQGRTHADPNHDQVSATAAALAEEAARLVSVLRESVAEAQLAAEHSAPTCRACPVCQVLGMIQQLSPEAVDHLAAAMTELGLAVRAVLGTSASSAAAPTSPAPAAPAPAEGPPAAGEGPPRGPDGPVVERIHIA